MKVCILALHLNCGGVERYISDVANVLCDNHDVEIISVYKFDEKPFFETNERVKIKYLTNVVPNRQELKDSKRNIFKFIREAFKAVNILWLKYRKQVECLKNLECDVVITTRKEQSALVSKYCKDNIYKIATEHNHHNDSQNYVNELVSNTKNMDKLILLSESLTDYYKERFSYTNVDVELIRPFVEIPNIKSSCRDKVVTSVGRLSYEKGFDDLLNVAKLLPDYKFNIIGDGLEYEKLKNFVDENNLTNVELHGFLTKDKIEEIYLKSCLYVMPSRSESLGLVILEAMSYSIPCISFDSAVGACELIKDGYNGYIIPNRDIEKMAQTISELYDSQIIDEFKINAYNTALKYKFENFKSNMNRIVNGKENRS